MNAALGRSILKRTAVLRNYSSLREIIPPNIGHAARSGDVAAESTASALSSQDVSKVVSFYRNLPKGEVEAKTAGGGPFNRYYSRYIEGENASPAPILHVIGALLVGGYSIHYFMHLKHHKHAENH
ncbi:ATP synthase f chain, mitochondrial precursor [Coemansia spiralis]|uniref:ATP synthase f chain, mitochondrial n=2 Tax=Coemansia TaxID=4863 RepID=A0A9W8GB44_9FUNG|nr:mitochondrial F1-F0 ATP synthase subunit F of fungi-domain-containing protein [Coemansia spiralis]KAJ1993336.1 ATP synthase f chain, mitochondrial precursor [Coemansia umbellata]KAJ2623515.1 ATP synthase f chain, mitochondrial precursor [Coemansia sp. RSA 1358]KAJ2678914.1 ATP synthase f chain, mitochondrial precursor [Coemansia spiralis]